MPKIEHNSLKNNKAENIAEYTDNHLKNEKSTMEPLYVGAMRLLKSINCMALCNEKADMYLRVAQKFSEMGDYKDAKANLMNCRKQAEEITEKIKKITYEKALNLKAKANSGKDYRTASEEFKKISGYRDSEKQMQECDKMCDDAGRKGYHKRMATLGIGIVLIVAFIIVFSSPYSHYCFANVLSVTGSYNSAIKIYGDLGNYRDSEEKLKKDEYLYGRRYESKSDYQNALKAYVAAAGYKDSQERQVVLEKQIIKNSSPGDAVNIGGYNWIILKVQSNKAFLIKKMALEDLAFNETEGNTTWETSTLRTYLNYDFYNTFSDNEKNNILQTDVINEGNTVYNTDGGNETNDYIFPLSINEAKQYTGIIPKLKNISWLRTPGNNQETAAFLMLDGSIMDYGYTVTSENLSVYPALWFGLN